MSLPPNMQQITTELTSDGMAGGDRTPKRVVMRSPTAVLYVCYGLQLWSPRGSSAMAHSKSVIRGKVTLETLSTPEVRAMLIEAFGPHADDAAILAQRSKGRATILVDGGGDPFGPTDAKIKEYIAISTALNSASHSVDLTGRVKTCRQCGSNLSPHTANFRMGYEEQPNHPRGIEDCQRLTNYEVIAVHGYRDSKRQHLVEWFQTWDGESYQDDMFCSDACAATYGRRAAAELVSLEPGGQAPPKPINPHRSTDLFEKKERTMKVGDRIFKV